MKRNITYQAELTDAIDELERKAVSQKQELKEQFTGMVENLKPINLIRHGLQSAFSTDNRQDLIKTAIGLGSGLLGRKLMMGKSGAGLFRKILGAALEFGVVGVVAKNAGKLREKGSGLMEKLFHSKKSSGNIPASPSRASLKPLNYFQKN